MLLLRLYTKLMAALKYFTENTSYLFTGKQPKPSFTYKKSFIRLFECTHLPCFAGLFITFVLYSLRSVNK